MVATCIFRIVSEAVVLEMYCSVYVIAMMHVTEEPFRMDFMVPRPSIPYMGCIAMQSSVIDASIDRQTGLTADLCYCMPQDYALMQDGVSFVLSISIR